MPIYEYRCLDCGADFEEIVPVNAQNNPPCPSCRSDKTEKKMSAFCSIGNSGKGQTSCNSSIST